MSTTPPRATLLRIAQAPSTTIAPRATKANERATAGSGRGRRSPSGVARGQPISTAARGTSSTPSERVECGQADEQPDQHHVDRSGTPAHGDVDGQQRARQQQHEQALGLQGRVVPDQHRAQGRDRRGHHTGPRPGDAPRQQPDHEDRARADDRPDDAVAGRAGDPDEVGDGEDERVQRRELGGRHVQAALQQLAGAHIPFAVGQHPRQQVVRLAVTDERQIAGHRGHVDQPGGEAGEHRRSQAPPEPPGAARAGHLSR